MQTLLDHLISIIIAGVVILALSANQMRSQHSMLEQTASHSVKAKTLVFGQWVEDDILNLGANFGRNLFRFTEPTLDARGNTTLWTFYSDTTSATGTQMRVYTRYRLVPTRTVRFHDGTSHQLYVVNRDSAATAYSSSGTPVLPTSSQWRNNLWSIGTLSFFRIEMLDRVGETPRTSTGAVDIDNVDYIRVRFGVVPEYVLRPDNYIRELYWTRTIKVRPYWVPPRPTS